MSIRSHRSAVHARVRVGWGRRRYFPIYLLHMWRCRSFMYAAGVSGFTHVCRAQNWYCPSSATHHRSLGRWRHQVERRIAARHAPLLTSTPSRSVLRAEGGGALGRRDPWKAAEWIFHDVWGGDTRPRRTEMQVRKATGWRKCGRSGEEEGHRLCFSLSQLHSTRLWCGCCDKWSEWVWMWIFILETKGAGWMWIKALCILMLYVCSLVKIVRLIWQTTFCLEQLHHTRRLGWLNRLWQFWVELLYV